MKPLLIFSLLASLTCCATAEAADFKDISSALKKPIVLNNSDSPRMAVTFNHASHKGIKCTFCHHEKPSDAKTSYASCGASEECHTIPGRDKAPQSRFMAYHSRASQRSCYSCHTEQAGKHPEFKGCRPCHMAKPDADVKK
ncbi:MAG: cytochrome c3 family protein [Desulfovibrionaceae bacterium]